MTNEEKAQKLLDDNAREIKELREKPKMSEIVLTELQRLAWTVAAKQVLSGEATIVGANENGCPIMRSKVTGFEWQMGDINFGGKEHLKQRQ